LEQANQDQLIQILQGAKRDTQLRLLLTATSHTERIQIFKGFAQISPDLLIQALVQANHAERIQVLAEISRESIGQMLQKLSSQQPESLEKERTKAIANFIANLVDQVNSNAENQIADRIQKLLSPPNNTQSPNNSGDTGTGLNESADDIQKVLKELRECDRLFLIQHPKGRRKEFVPSGSQILDYHSKGLLRNFIRYSSTADYGSSGSPVFNKHWELVALHHAAILRPIDEDIRKQQAKESPVESFQGVRICRIVEDLQKQSGLNPKLRNFLQDFVITPEQIAYPPITSALEFNGGRGISLDDPVCLITEDVNNSFNFWSLYGSELGTISPEQNSVVALSGDILITPLNQIERQGADEIIISSFQKKDFENSTVAVITDRDSPNDKKLSSTEIFSCCASSPNGKSIAFYTGSEPGQDNEAGQASQTAQEKTYKLRLWHWDALPEISGVSLENTLQIFDLPASNSQPQFIQFTPNSKSFAVFFQNGQIGFWHVDTIKQSPDSLTVSATFLGNEAKVTDVVRQLAFSDDSQLLAIASEDNKIQIWKSETGTWQNPIKLAESSAQTPPPADVALSPDGSMLAYLEDRQGVLLRRPEGGWQDLTFTNPISFSLPEISSAKSLKFSPDSQKLALVAIDEYRREELQIWEVSNLSNVSLINKWTVQANGINRIYYVPAKLYTDLISSPVYAESEQRQLTIEAWVNPINGTLLSKGDKLWGVRTGGFSLSIDSGSVRANFALFHPENDHMYSPFTVESPPGAFQANQLTHIALTIDTDTETSALYINGSLVNSKIYTHEPFSLLFRPVTPYLLGNSFNGAVTELRIWNHARTPEAIRANLYQKLYDNPSGLIGYWRFDEEMQESKKIYNLVNSYSSCYSLAQTQRWVRPGQYPDQQSLIGMDFRRRDDALSCTITRPSAATRPSTANGITVEAWIRHEFGNVDLFHLGQSQSNLAKYVLGWSNSKIRVTLKEESAHTAVVMAHAAPIDQLWHHIAFSWDSSSQEVTLYFDGRPQLVNALTGKFETLEFDGQLETIAKFESTFNSFPDEVQLGAFDETLGGCKVVMAEVRLWKVARSPSQIKNNLNRRLTHRDRDWSDLVSYWRLDDSNSSRTARNWVEGQPALKPIASVTPNPEGDRPLTLSSSSVRSIPFSTVVSSIPQPQPATQLSPPFPVATPMATQPSTSTSTLIFTDIQQHWAESIILDLASHNMLKGYPDRTFRPDQPMNRAEFATLLVKAFSLSPTHPDPSFTDVPSDHWARSAIWQAHRTGLLTFSARQQFDPQRAVTRIQAVVVLVAALKHNKSLPNPDLTVLDKFNDVAQLQPSVRAMLAIAVQIGMVKKPETMSPFHPPQAATRAGVCDMLARSLAF
jgi:WD40 repeat protein